MSKQNCSDKRFWKSNLETEKAYGYFTVPPEKQTNETFVWVPKSIIEHRSIRGDEHTLTLPDWFLEKI